MIYTGAVYKAIAAYENQRGAYVEVAQVELVEPAELELTQLARSRRDELLPNATQADLDWARNVRGSEDDLLVALLVERTRENQPGFTEDYEHTAFCTGCKATLADATLRFYRRAHLADNRDLILTDASVARDWADRHATHCTVPAAAATWTAGAPTRLAASTAAEAARSITPHYQGTRSR